MAPTASVGVASPVGFTAGLEARSIEARVWEFQRRAGGVLRLRAHAGNTWTWDRGVRIQAGDDWAFDEPSATDVYGRLSAQTGNIRAWDLAFNKPVARDVNGIAWAFTSSWEVDDPAESLVLFLIGDKVQLTATTDELYLLLDGVVTKLKTDGCLVFGKHFTPTEEYWPLLRVWPPGAAPSAETQKLPALPAVFRDGLASVLTYQVVPGVLEAIHAGESGQGWIDNNGETVPMRPVYGGKGTAYLSMRQADGERRPLAAVIRLLWAKVRQLDDLTSDVLLYCLCCWVTRTSNPGEFVWISADQVLDDRGISRKRLTGKRGGRSEPGGWQHGHRSEDRTAVWQALVRLKDMWIEMLDVEVLPARRRRKPQFVRVESPLLLTDARMTQHDLDDNEAFLAAQVAPGRWARELRDILGPQTGLLARKALEYDPYRERPEKRLAKFVAFHVRRNAQWRPEELILRADTLLNVVGDAIAVDHVRPGRAKERLEKALNRLATDQVIGEWRYAPAPELPARAWLGEWFTRRIVIKPDANVIAHYAAIGLSKTRTTLPPGA